MTSKAERQGKRGHDERGNVRPADDRYELHDPEDESKVVRTPDGAAGTRKSDRSSTRKDPK